MMTFRKRIGWVRRSQGYLNSWKNAHSATSPAIWRKTDLFTLLVEVHSALVVQDLALQSETVGKKLEAFYLRVDELFGTKEENIETDDQKPGAEVFRYLKAATKATNDKYARVDRGSDHPAKLILSTIPKAAPTPCRPKPKKARWKIKVIHSRDSWRGSCRRRSFDRKQNSGRSR